MSVNDHLEKTRDHKDHVPGEENGCLIRCFKYGKDDRKGKKGHSYRHNGRVYQEANESSYYNLDFTSEENKKRLERIFGKKKIKCAGGDPRDRQDAWHMKTGANYCHYKTPWHNVGHHVIPINTIGKVFPKTEELELLLSAKYNVNRGINIIILPSQYKFAEAMQLPTHPGGHPSYDSQVETMLNSIRQRVKKAEDPERKDHPELTPENVPGITRDIEAFAKRLRKVVLGGYSKVRHGSSVNKFRFLSTP